MANYGISFEITLPNGKIHTIHKVDCIRHVEGGGIQVWDTEGRVMITYGPMGYHCFKQIFPTERIA